MPTTAENTFIDIRGKVARVLLECADGDSERPRMAQRDIAAAVGTDWGMVHISLKSMQADGAIKIDRNRLIINKEMLRKVAGITA
jgi:predicted transcriptional regulator